MAAKNTELAINYIASPGGSASSAGGLTKVYGTATTSGGSTSVIIIPGYDANTGDSLITEGSLNKARGIRKIVGWSVSNNANSNAFKVVKSYDSTAKADKLTITCAPNDTFDYSLEGYDQGQNV